MSSIRLFILASFAAHGPMHGHRLRLEAERRHVQLWTDITVGAVYGAMKRLAAEGLLRESGQEREGNRPTRQLYEITESGLATLAELRRGLLAETWFRPDPFDLALTSMSEAELEALPAILEERLEQLRARLAEAKRVREAARPKVGLAKLWALRHAEHRLEAELGYLAALLEAAPAIVADERAVRPGAPAANPAPEPIVSPRPTRRRDRA